MKRFLKLCLLFFFCTVRTSQAFEVDIHYYLTFAIAISVGWSWQESQIIAAADQSLDENKETVASLMKSTLSSGQSAQNFAYHCFSKDDDKVNAKLLMRNGDVRNVLSNLQDRAFDQLNDTKKMMNPQDKTRALIAVGVWFHCQEDSWSHLGFGGESEGHLIESIVGLFNPDDPAARPDLTEQAIYEKIDLLTSALVKATESSKIISPELQEELVNTVKHGGIKKLGKIDRQQCVHFLIEHWLYRVIANQDRLKEVPKMNINSLNIPAGLSSLFGPSCREIHKIQHPDNQPKQKIQIDDGFFPQSDIRAEAREIFEDGSYRLTSQDAFDLRLQSLNVDETRMSAPLKGCKYEVTATVDNSGGQLSEEFEVMVLIISDNSSRLFGEAIKSDALGESKSVSLKGGFEGPCLKRYAGVWANIQPTTKFPLEEFHWNDSNIHNDSLLLLLNTKWPIAQDHSGIVETVN